MALVKGYDFLRNAIVEHDFKARGVDITPEEVFVGDGTKSDIGNFGDILTDNITVAVTDPVYPVYVDTNVMAGRAGTPVAGKWSKLVYLPCTAENGFLPELPVNRPDVIYLCYPNNPTGALSRKRSLPNGSTTLAKTTVSYSSMPPMRRI